MQIGFEFLTKEVSPSAFYDHGHLFDVPRCHENTRVAVLEKIGDWVDLLIEITAFVMWLYGGCWSWEIRHRSHYGREAP